MIKDRRITGFTNDEEAALEPPDVVPLLIADELQRLGARDETWSRRCSPVEMIFTARPAQAW
ncbi:hypothetical protein [Pseudomonas sp. EMN2]|uniref:hypothetical protein n=1 Tax=unclassified Pseudomonas TaxID=196821 RepID=UPI001C49AF74